jgi:hypothetical protein
MASDRGRAAAPAEPALSGPVYSPMPRLARRARPSRGLQAPLAASYRPRGDDLGHQGGGNSSFLQPASPERGHR